MPHDGQDPSMPASPVLPGLLHLTADALAPAEALLAAATARVRARVAPGGRVEADALDQVELPGAPLELPAAERGEHDEGRQGRGRENQAHVRRSAGV